MILGGFALAFDATPGLNGHGEASRLAWATMAAKTSSGLAELTQAVTLPRVQEQWCQTTADITRSAGEADVHRVMEYSIAASANFDLQRFWRFCGSLYRRDDDCWISRVRAR